jgi:hypothetical protein
VYFDLERLPVEIEEEKSPAFKRRHPARRVLEHKPFGERKVGEHGSYLRFFTGLNKELIA